MPRQFFVTEALPPFNVGFSTSPAQTSDYIYVRMGMHVERQLKQAPVPDASPEAMDGRMSERNSLTVDPTRHVERGVPLPIFRGDAAAAR